MTTSPSTLTPQPTGMVTLARAAMLGLTLLFIAGALGQFFLAGLGLFDDAARWQDHERAGHILGLVTYVIWVPAVLGRVGIGPIIGSILLIVLFYAQYAFINIEEPVVQALHPVNGTLLLIMSVWLAGRAFSLLRRPPERLAGAGSGR